MKISARRPSRRRRSSASWPASTCLRRCCSLGTSISAQLSLSAIAMPAIAAAIPILRRESENTAIAAGIIRLTGSWLK